MEPVDVSGTHSAGSVPGIARVVVVGLVGLRLGTSSRRAIATRPTNYDDLGRTTHQKDPDKGDWTFGYDNNGNLTTQTNALNEVVANSYDALNRMVAQHEDSAVGPLLGRWVYDQGTNWATGSTHLGQLSYSTEYNPATASAYTTVYSDYDQRGNPTLASRSVPDGPIGETGAGGTFDYGAEYDTLGHTATETTPSVGLSFIAGPERNGSGWWFNDIVAVNDITGDGKADILTRSNTGAMLIYFGCANGQFGCINPTATAPYTNANWALGTYDAITGVGDWNSDGKNDVLVRNKVDGTLYYFAGIYSTTTPNVGPFLSSTPTYIPSAGWNGVNEIVGAGDWDGNGFVDLLTKVGDNLTMYWRNSGGFSTPTVLSNGFTLHHLIGVGDFDGDGRRDLLSAVRGKLLLYRGFGSSGLYGDYIVLSNAWQPYDYSFVTPDFTGDGKADVLVREGATAALYLYRGAGTPAGGTSPPRYTPVAGGTPVIVTGVGDMTSATTANSSQGKPDFITMDSGGTVKLQWGSDGYTFATTTLATGWGSYARIIGLGKFDGDAFNDIGVINTAGQLLLYKGNGQGGFLNPTSPTLISSGWGVGPGLVVLGPGDFNGDNKNDVIARDANGALWLYPGTGTGTTSGIILIGSGWGTDITAPGDWDGDGKADLLLRGSSGLFCIGVVGRVVSISLIRKWPSTAS